MTQDEFFYPNEIEQWGKIQNRLKKLNDAKDELEMVIDEVWGEQNELHKRFVKAGFKLNKRTMAWVRKEDEEDE